MTGYLELKVKARRQEQKQKSRVKQVPEVAGTARRLVEVVQYIQPREVKSERGGQEAWLLDASRVCISDEGQKERMLGARSGRLC